MASYKTAIERIANIEAIFYKEHSNIFCDKKYAIFKKNRRRCLYLRHNR